MAVLYRSGRQHGTSTAQKGQVTSELLPCAARTARRRREDQGKGCGQHDEEFSIGIEEVEEVTRLSSNSTNARTNEITIQVLRRTWLQPSNFPRRRTGARLQNLLEMDDGSLQQDQCGFKLTELLAGSENACPRHR